jgi:hypothetical protein
MLTPGREVVFMVKIAGSFAALFLVYGVALAQTDAPKSSGSGAENVQSWHGILMDANCAGGSGAAPDSQAAKENSGENKTGAVDSGRPEKGHKKDHGEAQSCPVSSSTTAFALKTKDGQVMKFDAVGNARTAEELKTKGSWSKDVAAGKPVHAKVTGILNGGNITVTSISGRFDIG